MNTWLQGWLRAKDLQIQNQMVEEYKHYIHKFNHCAIILSEDDDQLMWSRNKGRGAYTI